MKARILIFVTVVSLLLLTITPSVSQVLESRWTADIPFDFIVGESQMPAGHYMIKCNLHTMRLTVINSETQQRASMFTRHVEKLTPEERTMLIFQREEGRHVLHQIWGSNENRGHDVVHGTDVAELMQTK
jgi:hypothetical protein